MPETNEEVVQEQQTEVEADQSMTEGFEQDPHAQAGAAAPAGDGTTTEEEQPEYVQVTKKDLDRLMAAAEKAETIDNQMSKVFGTIGNVKNEILQKLAANTPAGEPVEVTVEDFEEMNADFEELTKQQVAGLNRVLKKINLRGTGKATQEIDPAQFESAVDAKVQKLQLEELEDMHPGWQKIVGKPANEETGEPAEDTAFRRWLATQPEDYRTKIITTQSASVTKRAIDKFLAAQTTARKPTATPPADARRARIAGTEQPRGTGGVPPGPKRNTPEDELHAGFNSG